MSANTYLRYEHELNIRFNSCNLLLLLFFILAFSCFVFPSCKSLSPVSGQAERLVPAASPEAVSPYWQPFDWAEGGADSGLAYHAGKITSPRLEFYALRVDLLNPKLRIVVAGGAAESAAAGSGGDSSGGKFLSTKVSSFVRDNGLLAGINALPFDIVSDREGEPRTNMGIVVANRVLVSPPHTKYDALVFFADSEARTQAIIVAQSEIYSPANIHNAVGGFYRILEGGKPVPRVLDLTVRYPRSAAGISANGRFLYLLVIDGRRPGSVGSTEAETALILKALGASEGLNLDGGGSSALVFRYPDGTIRAVNVPIHRRIPGRERAVAGCLGVGINK